MSANQTMKFLDYHIWANARVFARLKEVPREAVHRDIQSVFPSIYETLVHMYKADNVLYLRMTGAGLDEIRLVPESVAAETNGKSAEDVEKLYDGVYDRLRKCILERDADSVVTFPHPVHGVLNATVMDFMTHLVNHGTYHRGNISAMLRQLGHPGASTDYVYYLYDLQAKA